MKTSMTLAAAASSIVSGAAMGQSNVTLYGVVDSNVEYVNHLATAAGSSAATSAGGSSRFSLKSGGQSGSRWGIRGVEDVGGGTKAVFVLESGYETDTGRSGQSGRLFGRQAYAGLQHEALGRITFGRQYTAIFDAFANFTPQSYSSQYEPISTMLGSDYRSDNVVKYTGTFGPLTAIADWSFGNGVAGAGEVPGQIRRDSGYGAALSYRAGAFGIAAAYNQYNPTILPGGPEGNFRKTGIAASYALDSLKLTAGYRWGMNKTTTVALRDDFYWFGARYRTTSALAISLAYYYDNRKDTSSQGIPNPWQVSFVVDYNLSKRTDIYWTTAYARNAGLNLDSTSTEYVLAGGNKSMVGAAVGIRHTF